MFHFIRVFYGQNAVCGEGINVRWEMHLSLVELDKSRQPLEFVAHICITSLFAQCSIPLVSSFHSSIDSGEFGWCAEKDIVVIFGQPKNLFKQ